MLACPLIFCSSPRVWTDNAIGRQSDSKKTTGPKSVFSRASRFAKYEAELKRNSVPGPGTYDY